MTDQSFTLYFDGPELDDALLDALFEAGCDDATIGARNGVLFAEFDRDADTLARALSGAIRDLASADPEIRIKGFEVGEPVSTSAIADRAGLTREGIRLLATGARGSGDFPRPVYFAGHGPLYFWSEAHRWLHAAGYECRRSWDSDSELALEVLADVMRLSRLREHWTPAAQECFSVVAEELNPDAKLRELLDLFAKAAQAAASKESV